MCEHLRSVGCDWNDDTCSHTVVCGHLDTLRWLREHGCPWNVRQICMRAADSGYIDILDFVIEQGEVIDAELLTDALNMAGAGNQLHAAQWLRQHGAEWPTELGYDENELWSDRLVAWARAEGCDSPIYVPTADTDSDSDNEA
jgi:hypothetical protein